MAVQELPELDRVKHYFLGTTRARQEDVVLGEGAAMVFVPGDEVLNGRPWTPGTVEVLTDFFASPEYTAAGPSAGDAHGSGFSRRAVTPVRVAGHAAQGHPSRGEPQRDVSHREGNQGCAAAVRTAQRREEARATD